ncbi:MAG: hypothetical protein Fur0046_34130 [Cyanobacteria bacterium J069]|nr:MAG: hypothetical protein D6742_16875 [Cyanobacteria bacterium J069]
MTIDELIQLVQVVRPTLLTPFQEWVLRRAWEGATYTDMAAEQHYRVEYIRRSGAELWTFLSHYFDQSVTKPHLREVLEPLALTPAQQQMIERSQAAATPAEFPSGPLPADSPLYVLRPPIEERAIARLAQPGSLIRIKAPMKMGKSSLILRLLSQAHTQQMHAVSIDFQQADQEIFSSTDRFLRWLCANLSRRLQLESRLDDYWDEELGSKVSCTYYLEEYILETLQQPLVLALDEVNRVFEHPQIAGDFLPLLRFWHTQASQSSLWQQLRLVLSYSTEIYVPLDLNHSPFNVGLPLELPPLTEEQVRSLIAEFGLALKSSAKLKQFIHLVGGFPYLVQLGLYHLQRGDVTLENLLQNAPTEAGIYRQHLRQHWSRLQASPLLLAAYQQVIAAQEGVPLEAIAAYQLDSLGLVRLHGNLATPSCELYRAYFTEQQWVSKSQIYS